MDGFQQVAQRIGQRIRELRRKKGITQRELAEKAGVFDVGELERGRKVKGGPANPQIETLHKIAVALDVDIAELLGQSVLDETAVRISGLLEGQEGKVKEQAVKLIEVLVRGSD
jgi:transcriptional regulator with XRE-family HTH domain